MKTSALATKVITNQIGYQPNFSHIQNVDKIEILWLNRVVGTEYMHHPVAKVRAAKILKEIRDQVESCIFFKVQAHI